MERIKNDRIELEDGNVVLYRRDDVKRPVWHCRISIPEIPYKNKRFTTKKYDLEEAKKVAVNEYRRMVFRHEEGIQVYTKSFKQCWDAFIKEQQYKHSVGDLSIGRLRSITTTGNTYLVPFFGTKQINKISETDVHSYWVWRRSYWTEGPGKERLLKAHSPKHRTGPEAKIRRIAKKPASTTLAHDAVLIKQVFEFARRNKDVSTDQIPPVKSPVTVEANRRPEFSVEEWSYLCTYMPSWIANTKSPKFVYPRIRLQCYVHIMYGTGMRVPNGYNLRWKDYSTFYVDGTEYIKLSVSGKIKGGRHYNVVGNINLKKWFDKLREISPHTEPDDYVFCNEDGSQLQNINAHFARLLKHCGLHKDNEGKDRSPYSLRHTMATHALLEGVNVFTLAKAMHTSVKMIETHYGHVKIEQHAPVLLDNRSKQISIGGIMVQLPPDHLFGSQAPDKGEPKTRR